MSDPREIGREREKIDASAAITNGSVYTYLAISLIAFTNPRPKVSSSTDIALLVSVSGINGGARILNFKADDFPHETEIGECFSCEVIKNVVPSTDDIRINLSKDEIDELKANAKKQENERVEKITSDVVDKMTGVLGHLAERINDGETFRDSTLDKVIDLCETIPALNVGGDAKIHKAHQDLMDIFAGNDITAESLRDDKDKAKEIAKKSEEIIDDLEGWLD